MDVSFQHLDWSGEEGHKYSVHNSPIQIPESDTQDYLHMVEEEEERKGMGAGTREKSEVTYDEEIAYFFFFFLAAACSSVMWDLSSHTRDPGIEPSPLQ